MNRFRRFLKLAWVAQLAFVALALPAAHVHRHGAEGCSSCGSDDRAAVCSTNTAHCHGADCTHSHAVESSAITDVALAPGETAIQSPTGGPDHRCAACELQRLIGHGFSPADTLLFESSPTPSAICFVSTCCGRDVEVRGCRGPPAAC